MPTDPKYLYKGDELRLKFLHLEKSINNTKTARSMSMIEASPNIPLQINNSEKETKLWMHFEIIKGINLAVGPGIQKILFLEKIGVDSQSMLMDVRKLWMNNTQHVNQINFIVQL